MKRFKIGTKVRTKKSYKRGIMKVWTGVEGIIIGRCYGGTMWLVRACSKDGRTSILSWHTEELEIIKPLKLKKFSAWK